MNSRATLDALNPAICERAAEFGARFAANAPFSHVVIDEFLDHQVALHLLDEFPAFDRGNFVGDDGRPGPKSTFRSMHTLGPTFAALDRTIQSAEFLELLGRLTNIDKLLYDPFYLGGGTHENRSGAALDPHVDFNYHPSERWHRRLNVLLYLNTQWQADWGGSLQLFADPRSDPAPRVAMRADIQPLRDLCDQRAQLARIRRDSHPQRRERRAAIAQIDCIVFLHTGAARRRSGAPAFHTLCTAPFAAGVRPRSFNDCR